LDKNEHKEENDALLSDLRVLDLADEKASFCSRLLADMGARVVKVERPGGDPSRSIGPFRENSPHPERSLSFHYNNANKLGITLDLEHPEGKEIFFKLVRRSDIVVESFPPGHLKKLGLDFEVLSRINSGLILVSVTGFGQSGPRSHYRSCDLVASAYGGQMYVTGSSSMPPLKAHGEQSYYTSSLFAAIGILLALRKRRQNGKGDHIDISLQEAVASTLDHVLVRYFSEGIVPGRRGNRSWNGASFIAPCKDGHLHLTLSPWETLVEWMAAEGMAGDLAGEKWKDEEYRLQQIDHIVDVVEKWTRTHSAHELFETGQLMRFPWATVCSPGEVLESPQLQARDFFQTGESREGERVPFLNLPFRLHPSLQVPRKQAPSPGEHNVQIYRNELGFSDEDIKRLSSMGVIAGSKPAPPPTHAGFAGAENFRPPRARDPKILQGLRVLDFTRVLAGPYATRILADFGAEVIKVQSGKTAKGAESNDTAYFKAWNRNKRGITLDLSFPEARELVLRLAAVSDVVIENFSPRVMANWGLSYGELKRKRPDLIMVSMSGMGQSGPWKDFVAFGATIQALSGLTYLTSPGPDSPTGMGYAYADAISGLYGTFAFLSALEYRDRTGKGQYIDLSEYEAMCALQGPTLLDAAVNHQEVFPSCNRPDDRSAAPYGCYRCSGADRWCVIAVFDEAEWRALCRAMRHPEWANDERFSTQSKRKEHAEELNRLLEQWTVQRSPEEIVNLLQESGVSAGAVQNAEDLAKDPHLTARDFFVKVKHPRSGGTLSDGSPIQFGERPARDWKAAPSLGQDNRYVFTELLGLTETELSACMEKGVIG
jgi:crotonobetainyl-CoA:carnitine CoA-transferase CaiB-like acyl-CoA transferase